MQISRWIRYGLFALVLMAIPASSFAGVFVQVGFGPPPLPVYAQPACPGDGYIWTPGYWAYGPDGYYWVPGTWVVAPEPGYLWTPGYWGWGGGFYAWHPGYWGPHVGFYGGINYGYGYFGSGYEGGYWRGRTFYYNRSVNNVTVTNVHIYNKRVNNVTETRVSYNGGNGGINRRPNREEDRWDHERHVEPTHNQIDHEQRARENRDLWANVNHGRPAIAATERPGDFHGHVVPAKAAGGEWHPENRGENRGANRPENRPVNRTENRPDNRVNRPDNRGGEDRAMNRGGAPRPNGGANNADRAPRNETRGNADRAPRPEERGNVDRGARPENRNVDRPAPRAENANRGGGRPEARPAPEARQGGRPENARPHENGGKPEQRGDGHDKPKH